MTTPRAILLSALSFTLVFLYVSLQSSYTTTFIEGRGLLRVNDSTGDAVLCELSINESKTPIGTCRFVEEVYVVPE